MPRELVHWHVLETALDLRKRSKNDRLMEMIQAHRAAAYVGAIAHDAPYFYRLGSDPTGTTVGKLIHGGDGRDTLEPMRNMAAVAKSVELDEKGLLWSFLAGMLSHIAVDVAFHPLVYYLTGDFDDKDHAQQRLARARHCVFEVYLDHWWDSHGPKLWNSNRISRVLAELGSDIDPICWLASKSMEAEYARSFGADHWQRSLETMSHVQRLFFSDSVGALVRLATLLSGDNLVSRDALFSFGRRAILPYFDKPIFWRNPVDGSEHWSVMSGLAEQAVEQCILLWDILGDFIDTGPEMTPFEGHETGSLSFGLIGAKVNQGKYYAGQPVLLHDRHT